MRLIVAEITSSQGVKLFCYDGIGLRPAHRGRRSPLRAVFAINQSPPPKPCAITAPLRPTKGAVARHRAAGRSGGVHGHGRCGSRPWRYRSSDGLNRQARVLCRTPIDDEPEREPRAGSGGARRRCLRHFDIGTQPPVATPPGPAHPPWIRQEPDPKPCGQKPAGLSVRALPFSPRGRRWPGAAGSDEGRPGERIRDKRCRLGAALIRQRFAPPPSPPRGEGKGRSATSSPPPLPPGRIAPRASAWRPRSRRGGLDPCRFPAPA